MDRGHIPPEPPGDPLTQMARCATARMRVRPAARPARNGTRRTPQRRRAAETVNVNVSCVVGAVFAGSAKRRVQWSYGAVVTSCSRGFAAVAKAPASIRWVAGWSTTGPDRVGMVTVMCCCRARWGRVVGHAVLPAAPYDAAPGASESADRAGVIVPAAAGGGVEVPRPGVVVASSVRQRADRPAQALVARPPEAGRFAFAGLDRDGGLASVDRERVAGRVTRAAVADLRQQPRGADHAAGFLEQRQKDRAVGMLAHGGGDLRLQLLELPVDRLDRRDQAQHQLPAGGQLELPDPGRGSAAELCQQLRGLLAAGVVLPDEEPVQARFSQAARVHGAGVALKERERDRAVQIPEQAQRTGPEPLKLRAQLVTQRGPGANQVLSCSGQRPERLSLIAVGLQDPEAVVIGPRELAQHKRVKPIGLPSRGAKAIAGGRDLVGMQRQDPQPRVQQPLDQQPIGPLNRDQLHLQAHQRPAQGPQTRLIVRERRRQ